MAAVLPVRRGASSPTRTASGVSLGAGAAVGDDRQLATHARVETGLERRAVATGDAVMTVPAETVPTVLHGVLLRVLDTCVIPVRFSLGSCPEPRVDRVAGFVKRT